MKKLFLPICLLIFLVNGCTSSKTFGTPAQQITSVPNFPEATRTPISSSSSISEPSVTPTPVMKTPLPESRLRSQCLDVKPGLASNVTSTGIVILNQYNPNNSGTFSFDMTTNKLSQMTKQGERQIDHVVSPDKTLLAYERILFDTDNKIMQGDFIIANANGQILKTIPVEKNWGRILGWPDNQHLFIRLAASNPAEDAGKEPLSILILNPFNNDERKILRPDFPQFLNAPSTVLPFWNGWSGVIYDPTLTRTIYPGFFEGNNEMYTYVLWDMSSKKVIASLENIFVAYTLQNSQYPMPRWSPDNSQFVVRGLVPQPDRVVMELYSVSRDGVIKQLTHLASTAYIWGSNLSWSPDGRYIAMFLGPVTGASDQKARIAVLDMKTLDVTDYCLSVDYGGTGYSEDAPAAIWSPNSEQFLVQDRYEKDHSRVILVDIHRNVAAQVAENMEAMGWMLGK